MRKTFLSMMGLLLLCATKVQAEIVVPPPVATKSAPILSFCFISFKSHHQLLSAKIALEKEGYSSTDLNKTYPGCKEFCLQLFHREDSQEKLTKKISPLLTRFQGTVQSCIDPQNDAIAKKPVIYLYPTKPQETLVQLDFHGTLVAHYPTYDPAVHGWKVMAYPDGTLIDPKEHREYSYLFWEGIPDAPLTVDLSTGFVVAGKDTKTFLQAMLPRLGLHPKEYNEFIVYWLSKMENHPYNLIHFVGKEYTDIAPLTIAPKPDSLLRVFMVFKRLEQPTSVKAQEFPTFERKGFTVIEWGGMEMN